MLNYIKLYLNYIKLYQNYIKIHLVILNYKT